MKARPSSRIKSWPPIMRSAILQPQPSFLRERPPRRIPLASIPWLSNPLADYFNRPVSRIVYPCGRLFMLTQPQGGNAIREVVVDDYQLEMTSTGELINVPAKFVGHLVAWDWQVSGLGYDTPMAGW